MKTIRDISILMAAVLICGCSKSDENVNLTETQLTITAGFAENDNTKTTLQDTGVYWEVGDEIKVFYGDGYGRFTSTNSEVVKTASFSGSINTVIGSEEGFVGGEYMWGLYPYRSDATYDGTSVTTTIPHQQTGKAGSFAKNMNISLAKSSNLALAFYNVCGGLRFSVTRDDITDVVLEGGNDEDLAGTIQVAFSEGEPVIQSLTNGEKIITLNAPYSETFESGKWYYIIAAPGVLTNGFKLTFNTATQYAELEKTSSVTVKRGIFGSVENADEGLVFQTKTTPSGNILFKDATAKFACLAKYDTDKDGEISIAEAESVSSFDGLFTDWKGVASFDEIRFFKNVHSLSGVFNGCKRLASITIPENITDLGTSAFRGCSSLTSVVLPSEITSIGDYSFFQCEKLTTVNIPSKVSSIGSAAFSGCSSLETIVFPDSLTSLGSAAFYGCSSLKAVNLPSGISSIPNSCFSSCSSLTSVTIPSGVTSIGDQAFMNVKIWKIELPTSVTSIGLECFVGATCVIVPSTSPVSLKDNSFYNVGGIFVPRNMIDVYKWMTNWCNYSSKLHSISVYREKSEFVLSTSGAADMGTSVKWAAYNVGASKPEEYGDYYAWGETETKSYYDWTTYFDYGYSLYNDYGGKTALEPEDDVAHVKWGGTWRMPTDAEMTELRESCYWELTTYEDVNGRMAYSFESGNKIFLPAAGYRSGWQLFLNKSGYYWSSSLYSNSSESAWILSFDSFGGPFKEYFIRYNYGLSVRPVSE